MRECNAQPCTVHLVAITRIRNEYKGIIVVSYPADELEAIFVWAERVLLDRPKHPVLDDLHPDVIDRAEVGGRYYTDAARKFVEGMYDTPPA